MPGSSTILVTFPNVVITAFCLSFTVYQHVDARITTNASAKTPISQFLIVFFCFGLRFRKERSITTFPFLSYFMDTLLLYMAAFCAPAFSVSANCGPQRPLVRWPAATVRPGGQG